MTMSLDMKESVQNNRRKDYIGPINQNDNNVKRNFLKKKHSFVTASTGAAKSLWPERGLTIHAGVEGCCSITTSHLYKEWPASYSGFNRKDFNYCPRGEWSDWVDLANKILAVDKSLKEFNK